MTTGKGLVDYYSSDPTTMNLQIEARASVEFPEITLCPSDDFNGTALKLHNLIRNLIQYPLYPLPGAINMTLLEKLDFFTFKNFSNIVHYCNFSPDQNSYLSCHTGNWTWFNGVPTYETEDFDHDFDPTPFYEIHIDSQDKPFTGVKNVTSPGKKFILKERDNYVLSLSAKSYNFLPLENRCNGDENYDYQKCVETALAEKVFKDASCSMPSVLRNIPRQANMKPECEIDDSRTFFSIFEEAQRSYYPGCLRKCKRMTYNVIPFQEAASTVKPNIGEIMLNFPTAEFLAMKSGLVGVEKSLKEGIWICIVEC
ncbi:unnamed protein product [Darwinula stevensoni]|uniref:Uncharacterized protein n=1 Tax=Darwinula stevensoni TaxID=69355 RepID=A0A7R8X529_9CRUS|nr:unnamed protein product [Darwinula stevensoni]CAG0886693.1 unnamed protein product [Darwinula stevensoni]